MLDSSDRLQPIVVQTCRGPEQLMRILETLARLELTDGLSLDQTIVETASRMPRDATVLAILSSATMETAVALGDLRRRGFAVTALVDVFHLHEFEAVCKLLMAEGIEARQVADEGGIAGMCEEYAARGSIRQSLVEFVS
jgi:hypothetical protein